MGICSSYEATAVAKPTAKLVSPDGKLQEFDRPVSVSHVLLLQKDLTCVVCNADDMEFDGFVSAVRDEEELQLGQLYFLLPSCMVTRPLNAAEMAALAVKANSALANAASCRYQRKPVASLHFPVTERRTKRSTPRQLSGRRCNFRIKMSPILE